MGATSARKAAPSLANTEHVIAMEPLSASQALDLRQPLQPARATAAALAAVRRLSPFLDHDRSLSADISAIRELVRDGSLLAAASSAASELP